MFLFSLIRLVLPAGDGRRIVESKSGFVHPLAGILVFIVSSVILGVLAFFTVMAMPCEWFGSPFEGACGYGAFFTGILAGLVLGLTGGGIVTILSLARVIKSKG